MKNEKLMWCAILLQLLFCCAFALFVDYGSESNGTNRMNSFHEVFGGNVGKNTLPSNYYSKQSKSISILLIFFQFVEQLKNKSWAFKCFRMFT